MSRDRLTLVCPRGCTLVRLEQTEAGVMVTIPRPRMLLDAAPRDWRISVACNRHLRYPLPPWTAAELRDAWQAGNRGHMLVCDPGNPYADVLPDGPVYFDPDDQHSTSYGTPCADDPPFD